MKGQLKAGATIDFVSPEEMSKALDDTCAAWAKYMDDRDGALIVHNSDGVALTSAGNTSVEGQSIYLVPEGYVMHLFRLSLDFAGSSATTPVAADVRLYADNVTPSTMKEITNLVPNVLTESNPHVAPIFRGGQRVILFVGGSATGLQNVTLYPSLQVLLKPLAPRYRGDTLQGQ